MKELPPIRNTQVVVDAFGYFPSFHDAEVIQMACTRGVEEGAPVIEFTLHGWEMTSEITETGNYRRHKHHLVVFRFKGVDGVELLHWNHQNVLFELIIQRIDEPDDHALIEVELASSFGLEGRFRALSGEVVSIEACDESGKQNC